MNTAKPTTMHLPPGAEVRGLMRAQATATLATLLAGGDGWPYASLVLAATAFDGAPLLLLSRLAEHTKNIAADPRVSLLFDGTQAAPSRLAGARATVQGRAARSNDAQELARFTARHPEALGYAGFADFGLYRVELTRAHLVAGFGRIHWVDANAILLPKDPAFTASESTSVAALNGELGAHLAERPGGPWAITGCDAEGCDLRAEGRTERVGFATPVASAGALPAAIRAALRA